MRNKNLNPWQLLGISKDATQEEIKKAYKLASLKNHPDRGGDADVFQAINNAYRKLKNQTHVPIIETNPVKMVKVNLSPTQQVLGVNGVIETQEGELLKVKIPQGARKGDRYSVKNDQQKYILDIGESKDKVFTRQGNSLIIDKYVDLVLAMRGGTLTVETVCEKTLEVDIPAGVRNGHIISIAEQGLYFKNQKRRGNLHIMINIDIPILNTQESIDKFITRLKNDRS